MHRRTCNGLKHTEFISNAQCLVYFQFYNIRDYETRINIRMGKTNMKNKKQTEFKQIQLKYKITKNSMT